MSNCDCKYIPVNNTNEQDRSWKPFLRQLLVCSGIWSQYFQFGLVFGAPTVIIPQMRAKHGQDYVTIEMASWISSAMILAAIPWPAVTAMLTSRIGRRYTFALGTITTLLGFAVLVLSHTPQHVLLGCILQGPLAGLQITVTMLVMTEYTSPQYRGVFLTLKSATNFWGIWVANVIGTFFHWRYIAALGLTCSVYTLATLLKWPESPYWLIGKGRVEECKESHRWLKGTSTSSENELQGLIKEHMKQESGQQYDFTENKRKKSLTERWSQFRKDVESKSFYKPLLLCFALAIQYNLSGKLVCSVYAIDIIKQMTHSESEAYMGMIILDGITVLGMYVGCYLAKKLSRRVLLLSAGGTATVFLLVIPSYLLLIEFKVLPSYNFVTIFFLTCYSISMSCGPIILNSTLIAELLPLKLRGISAAIVTMSGYTIMGTVIKTAPFIFHNIGIRGAFYFYGLCSGTFLVLLYLYLLETKDRSLKEIEEMMHGSHQNNKDNNNVKSKELKKIECQSTR